jgi:glutamate racemase
MDQLVSEGVKALVIACNSASAATLRDARERYQVPVVEVIGPAARRAASLTRNKKVGVIGTQATVSSGAYEDSFAISEEINLISQACPKFVELVENGITSGDEVLKIAESYLKPLIAAEVDTVVLGCTHYPLLQGAIGYVMGEDVALVSSAEETARDLYRVLVKNNLLRVPKAGKPKYEFLATGSIDNFQKLAQRFLGPEVEAVEEFKTR